MFFFDPFGNPIEIIGLALLETLYNKEMTPRRIAPRARLLFGLLCATAAHAQPRLRAQRPQREPGQRQQRRRQDRPAALQGPRNRRAAARRADPNGGRWPGAHLREGQLAKERSLNAKGNLDGHGREFSPTGRVLRDATYDDGQERGLVRNFYPDGKLRRAIFYPDTGSGSERASVEFTENAAFGPGKVLRVRYRFRAEKLGAVVGDGGLITDEQASIPTSRIMGGGRATRWSASSARRHGEEPPRSSGLRADEKVAAGRRAAIPGSSSAARLDEEGFEIVLATWKDPHHRHRPDRLSTPSRPASSLKTIQEIRRARTTGALPVLAAEGSCTIGGIFSTAIAGGVQVRRNG